MIGHHLRRRAERLEPVVAVGLLLGALIVLHRMGSGPLGAPTDRSVDGISAWAADRDPATTAVALLRLLALGLAWQQVVAVAVGVAGRVLRLPVLVAASAKVTLPSLRRAGVGVAGAGLTLSALLASPAVASAGPAPAPSSTVTLQLAERPVPTTATLALVEAEQASTAPTGEVTFTRTDQEAPLDDAASAAPVTAADPGPWTVVLGDHLWSIAERTVRDAGASAPDDGAVARYWRDLVVANGDLVDADLIFPGQVITRPPVR